MQSNTLVSICIPAYNCEKYILQTVNNLLCQTYQDIEIIVVNDHSTDNTVKIIKNITDPRLKLFHNEGKGAASARNFAFNQANGTFIKFMDADDLLSQDTIQHQVAALTNRENCIASARWGRFFKNDTSDFILSPEKVWKTMRGIDWLVESLIDNGSNMTQPGIFLIPKTLILKTGLWDENLSLIDDFDFMTRAIAQAEKVIFCQDATLLYRGGMAGSLSMKKSASHYLSAYQAQLKGIDTILAVRNDERSRLACANSLQQWCYIFYLKQKKLSQKLEKRIAELGGSTLIPDGGKMYMRMQKWIGIKTALRLRGFINRFRKVNLQDPKFLIPK